MFPVFRNMYRCSNDVPVFENMSHPDIAFIDGAARCSTRVPQVFRTCSTGILRTFRGYLDLEFCIIPTLPVADRRTLASFATRDLDAGARRSRDLEAMNQIREAYVGHRLEGDRASGVVLVQLPFPSQDDPLPTLSAYYQRYSTRYAALFPEYAVGAGDLWEAPLWVAHLDGAIGRPDTGFLDLSSAVFDAEVCAERIAASAAPGALVFVSPLAQNFSLAVEVSAPGAPARPAHGGRRKHGGAGVARGLHPRPHRPGPARHPRRESRAAARHGWASRCGSARRQARSATGRRTATSRRSGAASRWSGCTPRTAACSPARFCGDAWSRQLHVVSADLLAAEVEEIRRVFPAPA